MADKATPLGPDPNKYEPPLRGSVGERLVAVSQSGQRLVLEATLADPSHAQAPAVVADTRRVQIGTLAKTEGTLRQGFREATAAFSKDLPRGELDGPTRTKLAAKAQGLIAKAVEASRSTIEKEVAVAARREVRAAIEQLKAIGIPPPSKATLNSIASQSAANAMRVPFPGTDVNTAGRLASLGGRAETRFSKVIASEPGKDRERALDHLRRGLHDPKPGPSALDGGCVGKSLARINRTEQSRAMQEATVAVGKAAGVKFGYWRLSPAHRWYGGNEICEKLAAGTGPEVDSVLASMGVTGADVGGLYLLDDLPRIPHPNCMCSIELWHPPQAMGDLLVDQLMDDNLVFPDGVPNLTDIPQNAAGTLNRFAVEIGLPGAFDHNLVSVLGIDGAAKVLAQQVHPSRRAKTLEALRQLQQEMVPQIQASLNKAREHRDTLVKAIEANAVLAPESRASQIAEVLVLFKAELRQAATTVEALQGIERHMADPSRPVYSTAAGSARQLLENLRAIGFEPSKDNYRIAKRKGRFVAVLSTEAVKTLRFNKRAADLERGRKIKRADPEVVGDRQPEGLSKGTLIAHPTEDGFSLSRRAINIRLDQRAGIKFIEEQKSILMHFGAGLGKTPMVIGSVSDLGSRGEIAAACIATPASLRTQMVQEVLGFNGTDKVVLYVSEGNRASTEKAVLEGVRTTVIQDSGVPTVLDSEGRKVIDRSKVPEGVAAKLEAEIAGRLSRVKIKGIPKDPEAMRKSFSDDGAEGTLFTVMGHDDLASVASQAKNRFEYIAIDEVHQMTSQSVTGGSFKASQLQELAGGSVRYKVGLTGTAARNNVGELWDIADWLRPGELGGKAEFIRQFDALTLGSDVTQESLVKALRLKLDEFTYTRESPLDVKINNGFADRTPQGEPRSQEEKDKYIRKLTLTDRQRERAESVERQFERLKKQQAKLDAGEKKALQVAIRDDEHRMEKLVKEHSLEDVIDHPDLPRVLRTRSAFKGMSESARNEIVETRRRLQDAKRTLNPESWRDNEHHVNIHGGDWRHNAKIQETLRLVVHEFKAGTAEGRRPIIHVERIESLEQIRKALEALNLKVGQYDGSMSVTDRDKTKAGFNGGEFDVLIVTRAGSTGLNLQKMSTGTIHFDIPWTYSEYLQREARNWRTGQRNEVDSYTLLQEDAATDRRRLRYMEDKKVVLSAIDELEPLSAKTAIATDQVSPLTLLGTARRAELRTYNEVEAAEGRKAADAFLKEMGKELGKDLTEAKVKGNTPVVAVPRKEPK